MDLRVGPVADNDAHCGLESHRIARRRFGFGAALLTVVGVAGCGPVVTDAAGSPLNVSHSAATSVTPAPSLPPMKRFRIGGEGYGPVVDCTLTGDAVTCAGSWDDPYQADTYSGSFTGTLSGLTMTGTSTTTQTGHDANDPDCFWRMETSLPVTYTFSLQGTVIARSGPGQWRKTNSGSCSGTESGTGTGEAESGPTQWTVVE